MQPDETGTALLAFLRDLTIAWRNLATYPKGHPTLAGAVEKAHASLIEVLAVTGELALGVASAGLLWHEEKLDFPNAQRFGSFLHRHGVAVIRFQEGIAPAEVEILLRRLIPDPFQSVPTSLRAELDSDGVHHIVVEEIDYAALSLTDEVGTAEETAQSASVWDSIIRELMAGKVLGPGGAGGAAAAGGAKAGSESPTPPMAKLVAALLAAEVTPSGRGLPVAGSGAAGAGALLGSAVGGTAGAAGEGFSNRVAAGFARALGGELARRRGSLRSALLEQAAEVLAALPPGVGEAVTSATIQLLVEQESAAEDLKALAAAHPSPELLVGLRRLGSEKAVLARPAMALIEALLPPAPAAAPAVTETAVPEPVLAALRASFGDQDLDRFVPEPGSEAPARPLRLRTAPESSPTEVGELRQGLEEEALQRDLAAALLELLTRPAAAATGFPPLLARLEILYRPLLSAGRFRQAIEIVATLQKLQARADFDPTAATAVRRSLERLANRESMAALANSLQQLAGPAAAQIRLLLQHLGSYAVRHLLAELSEEQDRSRRHHLLDLLTGLGEVVVRDATFLLADSRWFVVRNMLILLRNVGDRSSLAEVRRCAEHRDLRVRLEAIKNLFAFDTELPRRLLDQAIRNPDPKLAEAAVILAGNRGIVEAVDPLLTVVRSWDPFGLRRSLRLKALRALSQLADPRALPAMKRFFKNWLFPVVAMEERRAAFHTLAAYPVEARAPFVAMGLKSRDRQIRALCKRLAQNEGASSG